MNLAAKNDWCQQPLSTFLTVLLRSIFLMMIWVPALVSQQLQWIPQGASPNRHGQVENIYDGEVTGAIQALAVHPTDPDTIYVGAVNGGIWKSVNAMASTPAWRQFTDARESLSIGAIEFDPTDASHQTVVAGIGRFSSLAQAGGTRSGLLRTNDGGLTWNKIDALKGLNISGVAPRGDTIVVAANDADDPKNSGIWRITGTSWVKISGAPGTKLPAGPSSSLASDPAAPARLYTNAWIAGLFRTDNAGATWSKVSSAEMDGFIRNADNLKISVGAKGNVYVAIDNHGHLAAVFHSPNGMSGWTAMGLPEIDEGGIHPGGQGGIHMALAADPQHPNIVYIGGDRQPAKFVNGQETGASSDPNDRPQWPNSIGARDYTGRMFRGDASQPTNSQWAPLTHSNTTNGSAPHADSRGLLVAANGMLINVNDGGIYSQSSPTTNTGVWSSMNGNLQVGEFHSVAWDSNSHTIVAGAQDTGTPEQQTRSDIRWESISTGDGGVVAIDAVSSPGHSVRYTSYYDLGAFRREVYDASNVLQNQDYPALRVLNGGTPIAPQFYTPIRLNAVSPSRMILGGANSVYESLDQGDTITEIGKGIVINEIIPNEVIPSPITYVTNPIAYGAANNPNMLYVGSGSQLYVRQQADPSPLTILSSYEGGLVLGITMDPNRAEIAFVVSPTGVYQTTNSGGTWGNITGNLPVSRGFLRSIAYSTAQAAGGLVVGTDNGVYLAAGPSFSSWSPLGTGLPNAPIYELEYNETDQVLLVGTLGRGAWTLQFPSSPARVVNASFHARPQTVAVAVPPRPSAAPLPAQASNPPSDKFRLAPGVVVDSAGGQIYSMDIDGGIVAADVKTGHVLWKSKEAAKPLGFSGEQLLGQVESGTQNALEVARLDPHTGRAITSASAPLPPQVVPSVVPNLKGDFSVSADRQSNGDTIISWQYVSRTPRALPPGTKPTLPPASGISSPETAVQGQLTRGAFKLSEITGSMQAMSAADAPGPSPQVASAQPAGDAQNREFLSADGRDYLVSTRSDDHSGTQKYTLTVYDRQTRSPIGEFKSSVAVVPFFVTDDKAVYEIGPSVQRTSEGLIEQPRRIQAVDLKTGNEVWTTPIRDSAYRGPFPP
jgi:photosystem II stability/assembly factor-like uncharacterized protein